MLPEQPAGRIWQYDDYVCDMDLDEDEMARYLSHTTSACPYFEPGNEYKIVRKQN